MRTMLKADFYRISKGRLGYIAAIILFLLGLLLGALGKGYSNSEIIESTLSSGSLFMPIMITNVLMIAWGQEFTYRTINNVLISGVSRFKYFAAKILLTGILTGIFLCIFGLSVVISTLIFSGQVDLIHTFEILFAQLPMYLALSALGVLLFNIIDVTYVAVTMFIVISFIGDTLISTIIGTYLKQLDFMLDYMFVTNISNVVNLSSLPTATIITYIWSAFLLAIIFVGISYQIFKKREFK